MLGKIGALKTNIGDERVQTEGRRFILFCEMWSENASLMGYHLNRNLSEGRCELYDMGGVCVGDDGHFRQREQRMQRPETGSSGKIKKAQRVGENIAKEGSLPGFAAAGHETLNSAHQIDLPSSSIYL